MAKTARAADVLLVGTDLFQGEARNPVQFQNDSLHHHAKLNSSVCAGKVESRLEPERLQAFAVGFSAIQGAPTGLVAEMQDSQSIGIICGFAFGLILLIAGLILIRRRAPGSLPIESTLTRRLLNLLDAIKATKVSTLDLRSGLPPG